MQRPVGCRSTEARLGEDERSSYTRFRSGNACLQRLGLAHQHIQFGTGTWDPILYAGIAHPLGKGQVELSGQARFTLYENSHDYRAGNQYSSDLAMKRRKRRGHSGTPSGHGSKEDTWLHAST